MGNNAFETVYRISLLDQGELLWIPAFGAVWVFLTVWGIKRLRTPEAGREGRPSWIIRCSPWFQIAAGAFSVFLCLVVLTIVVFRTASALYAYWSHDYDISEGVVTVLHKQPYSGHDRGDIIRLGNDELEINYYRDTPGYDRTIAHGGVLREGVYARVFHHGRIVLRIDIRKEQDARGTSTRAVQHGWTIASHPVGYLLVSFRRLTSPSLTSGLAGACFLS
jgi:hypothetical protein